MKKRLYRVLLTLTMTTILFCVSACGGTADTISEETSSETTEESVGESEETEFETEPEVETEANTKVEDGEYKIYPAFVTTFEFEDNILTLATEDVFEDFEIPEEMMVNFECPLAADFDWSDSTSAGSDDDVDWYEWFAFYWEGITMSVDRFINGQYGDTYISGEDFCKKNAVWTIIIENEEVQSISMDLVKDDAETETTEATTTNETTAETKVETTEAASAAPSAKEETPASTPTPAPVHEHSYTSAVTKGATCASEGVVTYTCSCGSSYTESIPCTAHTWKEIYNTVEHPSQGEMRQVQVGTSGDVYICNVCGAEFGSSSEHVNHQKSYLGIDNGHAMSSYTIRDGGPIYENQWIVTQEAYTETVVVGYTCTTCGATK